MIRTLICSALLSTAAPLQAAQNWNVGLTPNGVVIEARGIAASADEAPTILIIGGLSGND